MSLSKLKTVDHETKSVIFGYCRMKMTELSINLPTLIQYLFLSYYWIQEKFTVHGDYKNLIHVKQFGNDWTYLSNTVYGNSIIDYNDTSISKYIWSFRYINKSHYGIVFGIDFSNNQHINSEINDNDNEYDHHGYCMNGYQDMQ